MILLNYYLLLPAAASSGGRGSVSRATKNDRQERPHPKASKINISCIKKWKITQKMQHIHHSYQVNPEIVNNHYGLTSNKKKITNKERAMWYSEKFVRSLLELLLE